MNDNYVEITIRIDKTDYAMLENIAVDMSPDVYLQKFLKTRLFKNNSLENDDNKEKFKKLKEDLNTYNIKQSDIAKYFKVSQASVSTFLKKETNKSHLYPKIFTHSTSDKLLYAIYCNKHLTEYQNNFSKNERESIEKAFYNLDEKMKNENISSLHDDDKEYEYEKSYMNAMLIIASTLSSRIKNNVSYFDINEFIKLVYENKHLIIDIEHNNLNNKDLDYLNSKISYLEDTILPYIAF